MTPEGERRVFVYVRERVCVCLLATLHRFCKAEVDKLDIAILTQLTMVENRVLTTGH